MTCLLDTCTFLWLTDRVENLSSSAREILSDSATVLVLSQVSSIEIQVKYNLGKLPLSIPPKAFLPQAIGSFQLHYQSLRDEYIWVLEKLPALHRDPFDRLLIAHALHEGLVIITPDPMIHRYPIRAIW